MLVAEHNGQRVRASIAEKGNDYTCPECKKILILRKGRKVAHNFAHKPPVTCSWAAGETQDHLAAKDLVANEFVQRGIRTEIEFVVASLHGDRRADVMLWKQNAKQIAFELQHTPISLDEIERRANSYASSCIVQIWIPFLRDIVWKKGKKLNDSTWLIEEYPAREFEKWVHGFNAGEGMWMYDPRKSEFWLGKMVGRQGYVEETTWYSEGGEENYGGGYPKWSKRYKELTLRGPYKIASLQVVIKNRKAKSLSRYNWPACQFAHFVVRPIAQAICS